MVGEMRTVLALVVAVAVGTLALGWGRRRAVMVQLRRRLDAHAPAPALPTPAWWVGAGARLAPVARQLERLAATLLATVPRLGVIGVFVEQARVAAAPTEIVAVGVVVGPAVAAGCLAIGGGPGLALLLGGVAAVAPSVVIAVLASRRRSAFAAELPDVLQLLAGTLRAGLPLVAALEAVAAEAGGPVAPELRRVAGEAALGRELPESLAAVGGRMRCEEVVWVGVAVDIHQQAGGNLAEVLDTLARTVSERQRLRREVAALTAEGRISAVVLGVLPVVLAGVIAVVNPGYLATLLDTTVGTLLIVGSAIGMVVGFAWMHRIVAVEI